MFWFQVCSGAERKAAAVWQQTVLQNLYLKQNVALNKPPVARSCSCSSSVLSLLCFCCFCAAVVSRGGGGVGFSV